MRARGFTHVSVSATDLEQSVRFYTDFFGLKEVPSPDFSGPVRWLRATKTPPSTSIAEGRRHP